MADVPILAQHAPVELMFTVLCTVLCLTPSPRLDWSPRHRPSTVGSGQMATSPPCAPGAHGGRVASIVHT
ncbi:hypothetical protein FIBSPDRAFT_853411 [Athelia psychrophila]|uniref:Uncharacterized protein n=1 Tax=Athelia psychrophila TaxID=1759441 RepID=A0A166QUG9_9AGAM|nr:hypothetical protein FIBSPDRAFT_853411 [Fibularhizoctonia sp. CBS 109695]